MVVYKEIQQEIIEEEQDSEVDHSNLTIDLEQQLAY